MVIITETYKKVVFLGNESSKWCYIPILKNGHAWGEKFFKENFNFFDTENFRSKKYIVFLRDPLTRWYSAVAQWFALNTDNNIFDIDPLMLKLVFSAVRLDYHSDLQITWLNGLRIENCAFFNLDDENFEFYLSHFCVANLGKFHDINVEKINVTKNDSFKSNIIKQLKTEVEKNPSLLGTVKHFYMPDQSLIGNIKFYEPINNRRFK